MTVLEQQDLRIPLARALRLAQQLVALHAAQRVHGGLHPGSIACSADGSLRPYRPPTEESLSLSLARLRYAAPEQIGRLPVVDARSDLYSLGLVLYEWLVGEPAFDASDPLDLAYLQLAVLPLPPRVCQDAVPQVVSDIVMRLLAKAPDARYASARGLVADLQRCLQPLEAGNALLPFALCSADPGSQFLLPERLYGREREQALLRQLWQRGASGAPQLCLLAGSPGMGKTALVRALQEDIAREGGRHGVLPFRRPSDLGDPNDPAIPQRLQALLAELPGARAGRAQPLLLVLEDVQWADADALSRIQALARAARVSRLLMVAVWREDSADASQPLLQLCDRLSQALPVCLLRPAPLTAAQVAALIADSCYRVSDVHGLAAWVLRKTQGNPFYTRQLLKTLVAEGRLYFDRQADGWRWCLAEAQLHQVADTAVGLVARRLRSLAPRSQHALKVAAGMGAHFALHRLAQGCGASEFATLGWLACALNEGLLQAVPTEAVGSTGRVLQFAHDLVRQAALTLPQA